MAMIDVKTAVNKSLSYLGELMETTKNRLHDVRVEEVVFGDDSIWHVTISFVRESNATELARAIGETAAREFKVFEIWPSGEVRAMRIRSQVA